MKILRQYQLDIFFLFFALISLIWLSFFILKKIGADPHDYEWYLAGPLITLYLVFLLKKRQDINIKDRRQLTTKSLIYWLLLGLSIVASYQSPIPARDYWSINLFFLIFTLFIADSYWDFRRITMRSLMSNKKNIDKV